MPTNKHWDIFCKIVDNFGDIGVCWRLSQQLAYEHNLQVRLFIDDFSVAQKIIPNLDLSQQNQLINRVEICTYSQANIKSEMQPSQMVIETFSCGLPESYMLQMQANGSTWVNLEYLSAEPWVSDFHAKPSPHPTLTLTKYYFFPGFFDSTGGLIRENQLIATRDEFLSSRPLKDTFWQKIGVNNALNSIAESIKISFFSYPQANIQDLLLSLEQSPKTISLFLPSNDQTLPYSPIFQGYAFNSSEKTLSKGNLNVYLIPFLSQTDYDHLLWSCDLNFVRGEDSWIRAIWAGKPFIWQPYIQDDDVHLQKLSAFLEAYTHEATVEIKSLLHNAHFSWSKAPLSQVQQPITQSWQRLLNQLTELKAYSSQQSNTLAAQSDLATKLVIFSKNLTKTRV